jgi:hypothetical protein
MHWHGYDSAVGVGQPKMAASLANNSKSFLFQNINNFGAL